jgi:hypothetical protein
VPRLTSLLALVGTVVAAAVPLIRYAGMERDERTAIRVLQRVHAAQVEFQRRTGGFAIDPASLTTACPGAQAVLPSESLAELADADYSFELRAPAGAIVNGRDCQGREIASDYYVAAAPRSAAAAGRQAFAGRSDGRLHLFYDGIAPRETDIAAGLATPLELRETFKIP